MPDSSDLGRLRAPLSDLSLPNDRLETWWDLRFALRRPHLVSEHRVLGYLDTPNSGNRCWRRTLRRSGAWRHLLTIGSDSDVRFEVADAGRLQVAISPADLRRARFDRACGIFDSA